MTGKSSGENWLENACWEVPRQTSALALLWAVAAGMQLWSGMHDRDWLGRWAIMLAGAAAAWTAIVGVRYVMVTVATRLLEQIGERLDGLGDNLGQDVAEELVRRLELRRLEEQVARLVPGQRERV